MFGETDEIVNRKVRAAYEEVLRPILCVGETLEQREKGQVEKVLSSQLRGSLAGVEAKELHETVIAYEPVWAIGTGKTATAEQAQEAHAFIRQMLARNVRTRRPRKRSAFNTAAASNRTTRGTSFRSRISTGRWSAARASIRAVLPKSCRQVCLRNS